MTDGDQLWAFALGFYEQPGVAEMLVMLQDRHGIDVMLVLSLLHASRPLDREDAVRLDAAVRPWREDVVIPLRALRRAMRDHDELYKVAKQAELAAERGEAMMLADWWRAHAAAPSPSSPALDGYAAFLGIDASAFEPLLAAHARCLQKDPLTAPAKLIAYSTVGRSPWR